jgi:hypothetical protein
MSYPQIHYVLGWTIVLISHNWPLLLSGSLLLACAITAWRQPNRRRLAALYGSALLALAYEYDKHIGPQLQDAANYLLMFELLPLNRPVWLLVGPIMTGTILVLAAGFWLYALLPRRAGPLPGSSAAQIDEPAALL